MPDQPIKVLSIEDNTSDFLLMENRLNKDSLNRFTIMRAERLNEGLKLLNQQKFDVILLDLDLPDSRGLATFERVFQQAPEVPMVICSGNSDESDAIAAVQGGAQDYLIKSMSGFEYASHAIQYAIERQKNEQRFRAIFNSNPTPQVITDLETDRILDVNEAYSRMVGFSREELLGHTSLELNLWPSLNDRIKVEDVLKKDIHARDLEITIRTHSGEARTILVSVEPIEFHERNCVLSSATDITERKKNEMDLQDSNARFRALFEASPDAVILIDPNDWTIFDCNTAACQMNGYARDELIGQSIDILNAESPRITEHHDYLERIRNAGVLHYEATHRHKNGTIFPIEVLTSLITLSGHEMVLGIDREITNRKQAELALKASEENYRSLVETSESAIAVLNRKGRILYSNPHGFKIWENEELIGKTIFDVYPREYAERYLRVIESVIDTGVTVQDEIASPIKDQMKWFRLSMAPLKNLDGTVTSLMLNAWDITKHKQAELNLLEKLKLQEQLEKTASIVPGMIHIFKRDPSGKFSMPYVSPAIKDIYGVNAENTIGDMLPVFSHIDEHDMPHVEATIAKSASDMQPWRDEFLYHHPQKGPRWLAGHSTPTAESDGSILWYGIIEDITERKQAEKLLNRRMEDLSFINTLNDAVNHGKNLAEITELIATETKKIFGSLSASIFLLDRDKKHLVLQHYTMSSEVIKNLEKFIGMTIPRIHIPIGGDDHFNHVLNSDKGMLVNGLEGVSAWLADFINTTFLSNMSRTLLQKIVPTAARLLKINSVISMSLKAGNEVLGVIELVSENTFDENILERFDNVRQQLSEIILRRKVEQSLRESEENYRALSEASDALIVLVDTQGCCRYLNEKAAQSQGLRAADMLGKNLRELIPTEIADIFMHWANQVIKTGIGMVEESPIREQVYRISIQPIHDEQGKPVMALLSATDITDIKQTTLTLESRTQDLSTLLEAGRALSKTFDQKRIHGMVYEYVSKTLPCDILIVSAFNPQTEIITCEYMQNEEGIYDVSSFPPIPLEPPGRGTQSLVIRSGESMLLPDYEASFKTAQNHYYFDENAQIVDKAENDIDEEHPRSAILVPLRMEGRVMGVLQIFSYQLNAYTEDHLRFVETLVFHVSAALSNAKLVTDLEHRVRERTAEVRDLYDNAPAGYHSVDAKNNFVLINQTELNWLGYSREEMIGHAFTDFITQKNVDAVRESFAVLKQHGWVRDLEFEFVRKDGSTFPALLSATAINDAQGNFIMSRSTIFDITERKKVEHALRQSEETYRALFESANEGIFIFSLDNIIQRVNPHGSEMLGYSTEELVGMSGNDFIAQENVADAEQRWQHLIESGTLTAYERKLLKKDGTWVDTEISLSLIRDGEGIPRYIQSVARDVSTRKRAEETLRLANAELERALRMKDEFLANMSHELRTPLNAILGLSESMLEETAGPVNEKQKRYLVIVNESGRHLLELINDILDLAKIESGQVELDMKNVVLKETCEASMRMIKQLAHKKNQLVSLEIASEAETIRADERRLKQMIVNLLSNAVKFTPENKKLGLEVRVDKSLSSLLITVWDEGIGVSEQDLKRLFQPFVQLDSGLSRENGGTGLGLALVAEMARLHGGSIKVESKPGHGSRFTISLPWEESLPAELTRKTKDTGRLSFPRAQVTENPETILLVEDTDHVVIMIKDYLERNGYQVLIAQNGLESVIQAKTVRPDLILMDVQMPGMDGLEATRRIRQEVGLGDIPIVALTALAMSSDREQCLAAGMDDYISKPVNLKNLLKTIKKYLPGTQDAKEN